jgi:hypothetical protein
VLFSTRTGTRLDGDGRAGLISSKAPKAEKLVLDWYAMTTNCITQHLQQPYKQTEQSGGTHFFQSVLFFCKVAIYYGASILYGAIDDI